LAAGKLGSRSPRRPERFEVSESDCHGRASKHAGRSMKRTLQRRQPTPTEVSVGCKEEPTRSIVGEGHGLGEEAGKSTQVSSRRTGGGTCARSVVPKQGTSRWRPQGKDRRYNRCMPGSAKELSRGADRVVVAKKRVDSKTPAEQRTRGLAWFQREGLQTGHAARPTGVNRTLGRLERRVRQTECHSEGRI